MTRVVSVRAPARLHMGFLDLAGSFGRRFGSIGLTLDDVQVSVRATAAPVLTVRGPQADKAHAHALRYLRARGIEVGVDLTVTQAIPEHVGLGSGTQLALAVGVALARVLGQDDEARAVAGLHQRGLRSGIGLAAFEQGGFVLDGGKGGGDTPPPVIARLPFPEYWRVLLILDDGMTGLHGEREHGAFAALPPWSAQTAASLCHDVVLRILPALAEADLGTFGAGIAALQRVVGDHFAPAQGGRFTSPRVAEVLRWLDEQGIAGVGQSSWGPTGFALIGTDGEAQALAQAARERWAGSGLRFQISGGRNRGADIDVDEAART